MIRLGLRILAEENSPDTVTTTDTLTANKLVVGNGSKTIKSYSGNKGILLDNTIFEVPSGSGGHNKYLATNSAGELIWK